VLNILLALELSTALLINNITLKIIAPYHIITDSTGLEDAYDNNVTINPPKNHKRPNTIRIIHLFFKISTVIRACISGYSPINNFLFISK